MNEQIYLTQEEINHPYANIVTMIADKKAKYESLKNTLFAKITKSPEVLAEKLVFWMNWHNADGSVEWFAVSTIVGGKWIKREEAIAATVAKLNEVAE